MVYILRANIVIENFVLDVEHMEERWLWIGFVVKGRNIQMRLLRFLKEGEYVDNLLFLFSRLWCQF